MRRLFVEALENLLLHKTRSGLAALGIIFGVASVICMVSISEVARQDVVHRMERMGLHNVIVDSVKPERIRKRERTRSESSWIARYGITRDDVAVLEDNLPILERVVPMRVMLKDVRANLHVSDVNVVGTTAAYADVMGHSAAAGRFLGPADEASAAAVCVLGYDAARELFPLQSPVGEVVQIGGNHFTCIGVMERKGQTGNSGLLSNPDKTAYVPFSTTFARFGRLQVRQGQGASEATELEVNRAVCQVPSEEFLLPVAQAVQNLLEKRHRQSDVEVTVPLALLNEHRRSERVFQWVMGSLAAISLIVGGVGIMNIMLANMAERRQEIGLRRALGATEKDVIHLFVGESTLLCLLGGIVGMGVGAGLALAIGGLAQWTVVFRPLSFPFALGVSVLTGLIFGTLPAVKAAKLDPVLALRVE